MAPHASKPVAWRAAFHARVLQQLWKQGTQAWRRDDGACWALVLTGKHFF